jgi:hypothetical protein
LAVESRLNIRDYRHYGCALVGVEQVKFRLLGGRSIENSHKKIAAVFREVDADALVGAVSFTEQLGV